MLQKKILMSVETSINNKSRFNVYLTPSLIFFGVIVALILSLQNEEASVFPKFISDQFTFTAWVNEGEDYLRKHFRWFTKIIANYIKSGYYFIEDFLIDSPWLLITAILFLPCLIAGGLRLGLYSLFVVYFWGAVGMWDESMQTLALMGLSVLLCVFFGVTLGILCSQSDRFENFMKPIFRYHASNACICISISSFILFWNWRCTCNISNNDLCYASCNKIN